MTIPNISENDLDLQPQNGSSTSRQVDLNIASKFLSFLAEGKAITFQTFDDDKKRVDQNKKDKGYDPFAKIRHGTLEQHARELERLNHQGVGIFVCVNKTNLKGRSSKDIVATRAVFVDLDGAPLAPVLESPIKPQLIVESSPGRYHAYWRIDNLALNHFTAVQEALIKQFHADPQVKDLSRVMRLPGFYHLKGVPHLTQILEYSGGLPIKADDFFAAFKIVSCNEITQNKVSFYEERIDDDNPVLNSLKKANLLLSKGNKEKMWKITCPWVHLHNTSGSEAHYFEQCPEYPVGGFQCFHQSHCSQRTIKDLKDFLGLGTKVTLQLEEISWREPRELRATLPRVKFLNEQNIPIPLRGWIMDIADRMQIPPDFSAAASIVVCSSLIGRTLGVFPKEKDNWLVVPNLWGAIVGRPSLMKSPAINEVLKPLDSLIANANERYEKQCGNYRFGELTNKAQRKQLEEDIKQALKKKNTDQELLRQRFNELEKTAMPIEKRYRTEDGTIEKIGEILRDNSRGILIHRDELIGFLRNLEKEGRDSDRSFYLEAWNGTGSFTYDRIGRGKVHIPALCLSVLGGIQPGPLSSYVSQAIKGGIGDDGLLQRFQILVWPDAPNDWKNVDRWPDNEAKSRAYAIFNSLDTLEPAVDREATDTDIPGIRFDKEAQEIFNDWRLKLETKLRKGELHPALESHLAKYRSLMPSLSLLFQLIEDVDSHKNTYFISKQHALSAISYCDYLESHANRLYLSVENHAYESAQALLKRIRAGEIKDGFTARDVYGNHWSKLATPDEVTPALSVLVKHGWLMEFEIKTGGRDKIIYRIHPKLIKMHKKDDVNMV